jgi:lysozyme family protein
MSDFNSICAWLIYQEDSRRVPGEIIDLHDGAGLTRLGLTSRWHSADVPSDFFSTMGFQQAVAAAKTAYRKLYWNVLEGDLINSDIIAAPLFSFAVNDSIHVAVKTLQAIFELEEDGAMGPKTLAEVNGVSSVMLARLYRASWEDFYRRDVVLNPEKEKFLAGWLNRVNFPFPSPIPGIYV